MADKKPFKVLKLQNFLRFFSNIIPGRRKNNRWFASKNPAACGVCMCVKVFVLLYILFRLLQWGCVTESGVMGSLND